MLVSFLTLGGVKKLFGWLEVQYEDRFVLELVFEQDLVPENGVETRMNPASNGERPYNRRPTERVCTGPCYRDRVSQSRKN
jgi:hypothetical protein